MAHSRRVPTFEHRAVRARRHIKRQRMDRALARANRREQNDEE